MSRTTSEAVLLIAVLSLVQQSWTFCLISCKVQYTLARHGFQPPQSSSELDCPPFYTINHGQTESSCLSGSSCTRVLVPNMQTSAVATATDRCNTGSLIPDNEPAIYPHSTEPQDTVPEDDCSRLRFTGWRRGSLLTAFVVLASLILNICMAVWIHNSAEFLSGIGILFRGECDKVSQYNMWAHIGINAISTLLLSASNYAMQCFAAPTRADIDRAHQVGKWLDIGVPSLRNLRHIPKWKPLLWWMLALSSLPIYLL